MRMLISRCQIICLTLAAFNALAQQSPQSRIPTQSGDDAPIIIGDTSAFPFIRKTKPRFTPPDHCGSPLPREYRYMYSAFLTPSQGGKGGEINDHDSNPATQHIPTIVYACVRNENTCNYDPVWQADISAGDVRGLDVWDGKVFSNHVQLSWPNGNRIIVSSAGHSSTGTVVKPDHGLDLDYPLLETRLAGDEPDQRKDESSDFRIVVHYCTAGVCPAGYDPCASKLPSKDAINSMPKP